MHKKLPLLAAGSFAGLALLISSLHAADAAAPAAASGSAAASGTAPKPAAASGTAPAYDLTKLPKASDKKGLTFEKDVLPILKVSCSGCHVGSARPSSGLDLGTLATALKGGSKTKDKDIVPSHSDQSFLVLYAGDIVKGKEMPPLTGRTTHPPIKADDLAIIRAWIDQGAKGEPAPKPAAASASAAGTK